VSGMSSLPRIRPAHFIGCSVFYALALGIFPTPRLGAQSQPQITPQYRIDYSRHFFESPKQEAGDRRTVLLLADSLRRLVGTISRSARALDMALHLADRVSAAEERHDTYLKLRVADSTTDDASREARHAFSSAVDPVLEAERRAVAALDSTKVERFIRQRPSLGVYRFAISEARRLDGHTRAPAVDSLIAALDPVASGWQFDLYQRLIARTDWGTVRTPEGEVDVFQQSSSLRSDPDSSVRLEARRKLDQGYSRERDLYAFSLIATVRAQNAMARARGYADAPAAVFAARGLDLSSVRDLIRRVREHGEVSRRLARIQRSAPSWAKPRIPFDSASSIIRSALAPLGPEYGHELAALLDPANGRLDIGPGPTRQATGFSWENPDRTTGVYLYFFDGSVRDVSRLAHESGHAMHRRLMSLSRVPRVYTGGPLLAEPAAQFNELLVTDYLARTAADTATRSAALARFLAVALDAAYGAQDADLELQVYDSVAAGSVHSADDLDRISARVDSAYDVPEDGDAAGHRWMRVSLMWEDPLYLSNYMYSGMLALAYFTRFASDSARFVPAYLSLLRGGWPAPAQQLLQRQLGMSIADTSLVTATFRSLQPRLEALDRLYRGK
jgi:oligoendopeptidase F